MKIYALIGPSGTGKSHRASMVAIEKNAEAIIDDGLLIADGRIVAGYSAKREATRVAAVKRAIFSDPEHAASVRQAIARLNLSSLLILGTSVNMVNHIVRALHLDPDSVMWIPIETIASPEERALAQKIRREQGKHVIPAPTMEVRKSFSGYLIDPLRFIFRRKGRSVFVEKSIVRPTYSGLGRFYISDTVITAIVVHAARQNRDVSHVYRVVVQSTPAGVSITVELGVSRQCQLFALLEDVQTRIRQAIEEMTALNVLALDIEARHFVVKTRSETITSDSSAEVVPSPIERGGYHAATGIGRG
ncbi:MAG: hypothetical protein C7B47_04925 [Sulfobacillus thermosulfidooxidans]|uniref:Asp23/Gls24 family envelope stress response protein n=1 Tax=Sulfobacillus thermosulfidooxidans TaxID=28034 RepID=A0A2T2X1Z1_SULTH|nr:MAG: hypothetical protein C7B47_04925 [Sulfobacillus thermosulfidooxidans]